MCKEVGLASRAFSCVLFLVGFVQLPCISFCFILIHFIVLLSLRSLFIFSDRQKEGSSGWQVSWEKRREGKP